MRRIDNTEFLKAKRKMIWKGKTKCFECNLFAEEMHHKDGNHNNNVLDNLTPLCKLCHIKKHCPNVKRLVPAGMGYYRKNKIIIEMTRKEILTDDDLNYLKSVEWGKRFIEEWF